MANVYTNYKAVLSTNELTTLYTVPTTTTGIIKSLRVTNIDEENDCKISCFVVDSSSVSYTLELQAQNGGDLHVILSVLELSNT